MLLGWFILWWLKKTAKDRDGEIKLAATQNRCHLTLTIAKSFLCQTLVPFFFLISIFECFEKRKKIVSSYSPWPHQKINQPKSEEFILIVFRIREIGKTGWNFSLQSLNFPFKLKFNLWTLLVLNFRKRTFFFWWNEKMWKLNRKFSKSVRVYSKNISLFFQKYIEIVPEECWILINSAFFMFGPDSLFSCHKFLRKIFERRKILIFALKNKIRFYKEKSEKKKWNKIHKFFAALQNISKRG